MSLTQNISLKAFNSFGVDARARYLLRANSSEAVLEALADPMLRSLPRLVLGGGSNVVFVDDWPGVVIQLDVGGVTRVGEVAGKVLVRAGAGERWDDVVRRTIEMGYAGLENLSLIPGSVGAAPIQNIGAYGVELSRVFHQLDMVDLETGERITMDRDDCAFGYRDSWFKQQPPGRYLIVSVTLALPKTPSWALAYGELAEEVARRGNGDISAALIRDVVCDIRRRKLPDPGLLGNAGSFFKNPLVSASQADALLAMYPDAPLYPAGAAYKLSAGWLVERCGWKGRRRGDAGVSEQHALVLVNYGNATGAEIWSLATEIIDDVFARFGIMLEPEPRILGANPLSLQHEKHGNGKR